MLSPDHPIRRHPVRWVLKALAVGALPALFMAYFLGGWQVRNLVYNMSIGATFSVVMWLGFELSHDWVELGYRGREPLGAALSVHLRWLGVYLVLLAICVGLVRVTMGINLLAHRVTFLMVALVGLLISSLIVGFEVTKSLVSTARELERARAQAGFLALQAQLSPHTLFNALNTIAALIPEEPARAEEATEHLARLLRRMLLALEREAWSLEEEFALLRELLALERLRFGERLRFELVLEEAEGRRMVPPLLLLPLVENALKHGFRPKPGSCSLRVEAHRGGVRVVDDGVGRRPEAPEGVGLRMVRQRLEAQGGALAWPPVAAGCAVEVAWA